MAIVHSLGQLQDFDEDEWRSLGRIGALFVCRLFTNRSFLFSGGDVHQPTGPGSIRDVTLGVGGGHEAA